MTREQKEQVRDALLRYVSTHPTQQVAAQNLDGISSTRISLIKNRKWEHISDEAWLQLAKQVGFYAAENWKQADTGAYLLLKILFGDAQRYSMVYAVTMAEGLGKTFCGRHYADTQPYTYYISCDESMNRKSFLVALLHAIYKKQQQPATIPVLQTGQMLEKLVSTLEAQEEPLIIIDDADKLKERVLHFIVALYKRLINDCGIVLLGREELRMRIIEGTRMQQKSYEDLYNTIGRRFVTLDRTGPKDVRLICKANGIMDMSVIAGIETQCAGNLQNIDKLIHKAQMQNQQIAVNE